MDTNDSNMKPQQTGGLKIMTVFAIVLAAHVIVIGGYSAYMLMNGGNADADLTITDKTHQDLKSADGSAVADSAAPDAQTATLPTDATAAPQAASSPANPPASAPQAASSPDQITTTEVAAPTATAPATLAPPPDVVDQGAPPSAAPQAASGPISPELAPPEEPAPALSASAPSGPQAAFSPQAAFGPQAASGPVHMPPAVASAPVHQQIYVVKITDSYKKIAHAHHVTVAQLKEANHITGNILHTGQKLIIPSQRMLVAENVSAPVTSLDGSSTALVLNEPAPAPTASLDSGSSIVEAAIPHRHVYTVVKGDTLIKIARKFRTTAAALMTENSITDPTKLAIGKKLRIPSGESRSAGNAAPSSTQPGQVQTTEAAPSAQLANFQR
jgi:LysM repeat protein